MTFLSAVTSLSVMTTVTLMMRLREELEVIVGHVMMRKIMLFKAEDKDLC